VPELSGVSREALGKEVVGCVQRQLYAKLQSPFFTVVLRVVLECLGQVLTTRPKT
jgi:hypothetical protein